MTHQTKLDKDKPVYLLDIKLIDLNISLTKGQYLVIVKLADIIKAYSEYIERW